MGGIPSIVPEHAHHTPDRFRSDQLLVAQDNCWRGGTDLLFSDRMVIASVYC